MYFLCLASFTHNNIFEIDSCCMYQEFIPFYYWGIFNYINSPLKKKIHSLPNKQLDSFQVLTIMNNVDLTIHILVFVWTQVLILLG